MKNRYTVNSDGVYPRPFRVIDKKLRTIIAQSETIAGALAVADKLESEWRARPTRRQRFCKFISSIINYRRRNAHERRA